MTTTHFEPRNTCILLRTRMPDSFLYSKVVNPQVHLQRMQAATTSANSHLDSNVTSHNHHHGSPEHPGGDSPGNGGHMSGVPINVLSMQGSEGGQNHAVYTSGNMPLMYNSGGILYATPPTTQSTMSDGDSNGQPHHLVMQDGTVVTNQGIPVSLQHVPGTLQVIMTKFFRVLISYPWLANKLLKADLKNF